MARFMLFLFMVASMILISRARSFTDYQIVGSPEDKGSQIDSDKINDEENLKQYEQDEMEGAYDANLAKIPGKGSRRPKAICLKRRYVCSGCWRICTSSGCHAYCKLSDCRLVCVKYG